MCYLTFLIYCTFRVYLNTKQNILFFSHIHAYVRDMELLKHKLRHHKILKHLSEQSVICELGSSKLEVIPGLLGGNIGEDFYSTNMEVKQKKYLISYAYTVSLFHLSCWKVLVK